MKKEHNTIRLFIAVLLILGTLNTDAQFLKVGPKAGANLVKINGLSFKEGFNSGYYAGAFVEVKFGKKWFLQPEVLFNQNQLTKSSNFRGIYQNLLRVDSIGKINLQTLSIPITLNWRLANVLAFSLGTQFSFIMDRNETLLKNAGNTFSKGDLSLIGGANITVGRLRVTGRYGIGLKNLNDIDSRDQWKSQTAQIGLGFVF